MPDHKHRRLLLPAVLAITIPVITFLARGYTPALGQLEVEAGGSTFPPSKLQLTKADLGPPPTKPAGVTNVQILDFDGDGRADVLACDGRHDAVFLYRQTRFGVYEERLLSGDMAAPAHATAVDLDLDGDLDLLVSALGSLTPNDDKIGKLILLENSGDNATFRRWLLLDNVRRIADAQAGDLDGDGDLDIAVAEFGQVHGRILWMEHTGPRTYTTRTLHHAAGGIHVPLADYDGDGDLDIATVISQDDEEVWGFENLGQGRFKPHRLWFTFNFDLGSAGLVRCDLDGDGDDDLLLPAGDNFEVDYMYPQPYHGCLWLENRGGWRFATHRIATFGGTYAAGTGDLDGDGDLDVVLVSWANEWRQPGRASVAWLENDGAQNFKTWQLADRPRHLATVAVGDLDGDARADIVAGSLHINPPYDHLDRISIWTSRR